MLLAVTGAVLGWSALLLQLSLTLTLITSQGGSIADGVWRAANNLAPAKIGWGSA